MADVTDEEILSALKAAILEIIEGRGSSYSIAGRQWTALDLDKLRAMEKDYSGRVKASRRQFFQRGGFGE